MANDSVERKIDNLAAEMRQRFDAITTDTNGRFERVDARFEQVDARFERVDARFDTVDRRFGQMTEELKSHMNMVGERLEMRFQQAIDGQLALRDRVDAHDRRHDVTDRKVDVLDLRVTALEHRDKR
jgi:hypothetical protein